MDVYTHGRRSTEDIKKELIHRKDNKYPRLVLSVIGDSSTFVPKPWHTPVLQLGLIETAKGANDCIILYKGSKEKISKLVWEAVHNYHVLNQQDENSDEKKNTSISLVGIRPSEVIESSDKYEVEDKYFILEDDAYVELLSEISNEYVPFVELGKGNKLKMPVIVIVAEGDRATIDLIKKVLKSRIPILVLKGSGKAADLIADCLDDLEAIKMKAPLLFGTYFDSKEMDELKQVMEYISEQEQFVNVLDINEHDEAQFPDAVSKAIIRAWAQGGNRPVKSARISRKPPVIHISKEEERYREIDDEIDYDTELGIQSDSPQLVTPGDISKGSLNIDIPNGHVSNGINKINSVHPSSVTLHNAKVKGDVKKFMERYQTTLTPASLSLYFYIAYQFIQEVCENKAPNFKILLKQALVADRVDYVKVLLQEEDVTFDKEKFPDIYSEALRCDCIEHDNAGDCQHMWSILEGASSDSTGKLMDKEMDYQVIIQAGRQLCQKFLHYPRKYYKDEDLTNYENDREIYHDLLIWSLFCNRRELATLFWSKGPNQLETAVLASCVLKRMAARARSGKDQFLYNSLKEHSEVFAQRSLKLQTLLYEEDPDVAMEMMMADCSIWDIEVNPLECAHDNVMLDFIAHSCAQRRLNQLWYKKIGATLGDFWKNGFFCGCKKIGKKDEKAIKLPKFLYAPLTRFLVHYILFICALVCYSAFLLIELSDFEDFKSIKIYEWLIYIWLVGDIIEEYRGVISLNNDRLKNRFSNKDKSNALSQTFTYRLKRYIYDFWNALDVFSYLITIAAILVRFLKEKSNDISGTSNGYTPDARLARRLYSLSLFTLYMRFLHAILMSRKLGPKIIMIKEMLKELFRFIGILFVFMIGVGVLYHANMYPAHYDMWNVKDWTYWRIWKIIYIPYWQIYGELFLDEFQANSTTPCTTIRSEWESNPDIERCSEYDWVLIVIAALYLLISNLLLVNLVIALFSYRFEIVQANSERLWRYWRYAVIMDFRTRVPAPLNLVIRPFMLIWKCIKKCSKDKPNSNKREVERMKTIQDISANRCIRLKEKS